MVLVEAMAVGKRIVASRNTAIEEIIGHTACGTLFETRDLKDLTLSIKRVLAIDHETISTAQIDRLHDFEIGHTAKKIQELYGKVSQPL
jgi:glycosyltransferase involved in cell wall biosynthesis